MMGVLTTTAKMEELWPETPTDYAYARRTVASAVCSQLRVKLEQDSWLTAAAVACSVYPVELNSLHNHQSIRAIPSQQQENEAMICTCRVRTEQIALIVVQDHPDPQQSDSVWFDLRHLPPDPP